MFEVEVAYVLPDQSCIIKLQVVEGTTVEGALAASDIALRFPELDLTTAKIGIYSQIVSLNTQLRPHDRIEIYRPLLIDPKAARFKRVATRRTKASR